MGRRGYSRSESIKSETLSKVDNLWGRLKRRKLATVRGLCCGGCSAHEGGNRMDADESLTGYVFYHSQDTEDHERTGLHIGYGARAHPDDEGCRKIGELIRDQAQAVGLEVEWNGSPGSRVLVGTPEVMRRIHERRAKREKMALAGYA